jgi:hypothetical protein
MYSQLGVLSRGTIIEVNVSELGLVTTGGKVVWGKYAQVWTRFRAPFIRAMARIDANVVPAIDYKVSLFHHSMYQRCLGVFGNHDGLLCLVKGPDRIQHDDAHILWSLSVHYYSKSSRFSEAC